jgi:microcystin-dependent protein
MASPYLGEIKMFGGNFAPRAYALCNGQPIAIRQNTALFSILGVMYGGDGVTTFALPDLQGQTPMAAGDGPGLTPRGVGETGGVTSVTLQLNELANHNHLAACANGGGTQSTAAGAAWAGNGASRGGQIYADTAGSTMNGGALLAVGNNQAHTNMQPYLAVSFIIALTGVFPQRS